MEKGEEDKIINEVDPKILELCYMRYLYGKENDLYLCTKNKLSNVCGVASFCVDGTIKVFEGDSSGKDDKVMTYEEFINDYFYHLSYDDEYYSKPIKI